MHILMVGYGKTSKRLAHYLLAQGHHLSTISRQPKSEDGAVHFYQDIHQLNLSDFAAIDMVYVLLSPSERSLAGYRHTYLDSVQPICAALQAHPVQRVVVVSSTRVYGARAGTRIDDDSPLCPDDMQGEILMQMEQAWQHAYAERCVIVRPTGIYGISMQRLSKMAAQTLVAEQIQFSNRIHVNDLARFLADLAAQTQQNLPLNASYIVTDNIPRPQHEILAWLQQRLDLPVLQLTGHLPSGKLVFAQRMYARGFVLQHPICFDAYAELLDKT